MRRCVGFFMETCNPPSPRRSSGISTRRGRWPASASPTIRRRLKSCVPPTKISDLLTVDQGTATSLYEDPFAFDRSIVFLNVGEGDVERDDAIDRLFARYRQLTPGRLCTVTESRVKIRQLPSR